MASMCFASPALGIAAAAAARPRQARARRAPLSCAASNKPIGGLDPSEGVVGFKPFPELLVGRLAMMGFASGVTNELVTGHPILQQIGLTTPSTPIFTALCVAMGGATLVASANTLKRVTSGDMPPEDVRRYQNFLGISAEKKEKAREAAAARAAAAAAAAPLAASADGAAAAIADPAAAALAAAAAAPAAPTTPPMDPAKAARKRTADFEAEYARGIELTNGRWAMLGFASAILIEAFSGDGIVGQLIFYCRFLGLLGDQSGFN